MPTLSVIIGSTLPVRAGLPIADWFVGRARRHGGFDVEVADLAEIRLPLFDEPEHPRFGRYVNEHTRAWSRRMGRADAVVFVTPEYNYGFTAPVKNAIDYLHAEWKDKPVGFVSYGGVAAGTRAVQQLKQVVSILKMVPVAESVNVPFHAQYIGPDGVFRPNDVLESAADALLDELARLEGALRPLRPQRTSA